MDQSVCGKSSRHFDIPKLNKEMLRNVPLIVIIGSTGTGKTKLSIELAQKFGAQIISADSMQVYKGLDIVTAKATKPEQSMAKHHMLDIVDAGKMFTVVDFRDAALPIIDDLLQKKKIPILVGGTNYYIESILWKVLVNPPKDIGKRKMDSIDDGAEIDAKKPNLIEDSSENRTIHSYEEEFKTLNSLELYKLLESVDPDTAKRLHPNDIRKIKRALEVYRDHGKTLSAVINEQKNIPGGSHLGGPLRYEHIILFWLQCEQEVLNKRLDSRIDEMLLQGLLKEIREFYNSYMATTTGPDYTKGPLQTIGFKELIPYLEKYDEQEDERINAFLIANNKTEQSSPEGLNLLQTCLDSLRLVTKRYSKRQPKWIRNRFLSCNNRHVPPMYELSTTDPENWHDNVYRKAENVVESYIDNREADLKPLEQLINPRKDLETDVANVCEVCDRHFVGEFQWSLHMRSNRHKKRLAKLKKNKMLEESTVTKVE